MKSKKIPVINNTYQQKRDNLRIQMFDHVSNKLSPDLVMEIFEETHNKLYRQIRDQILFQIKLNLPL